MEEYEVIVPLQSLKVIRWQIDALWSNKTKKGDVCPTSVLEYEGDQTYGLHFTLTATFEDIDVSTYDGLVIPGGLALEHNVI